MKKVFIVTEGEEYWMHVTCVFSKTEDAEAYLAAIEKTGDSPYLWEIPIDDCVGRTEPLFEWDKRHNHPTREEMISSAAAARPLETD